MRVLNIGSLNIDYVYRVERFARPGETLSAVSMQAGCGGKGLNQSAALARAGVETWHAGLIGAEGAFLREKLAAFGVHTELVRETGESTGHAVIQVDASGQNSILVYGGANRCLTEAFVDAALAGFGPGDWLLLQNETACVGYAAAQAKRRGLRVALNAAPADGSLWETPLELVDLLFVNETEGAFLAGAEVPEEIAAVLTARYPDTALVLTLGEDGALAAGCGREPVRAAAFRVPAVDTTAAGDTFTGFFLRGVLDGWPPEKCLRLAAAAAALAVTRRGAADSVPTYGETAAFLAGAPETARGV